MRALLLGAALLASAALPAAHATSQREVEEALTCQCGCGLTVHACNHLQCPSGEPMKTEIADRLRAGDDKETILAAFRTRFGEKVLSSPTFRGFNWFAWITPFAAIGVAGLVLVLAVRRWRPALGPEPEAPPVVDPALRRRLERELAELEREC